MKNQKTGKAGEEAAAKYLEQKGYEILDRNWHYGKYEIDLIARQKDELVFVEVKTRNYKYVLPEYAVGKMKQTNIRKGAEAYMHLNSCECAVRFDIIAIIPDTEKDDIFHIEDAFFPFYTID